MEKELENYLSEVENHLRSMPTSERIDVVKELKSYIEELQHNDKRTSLEIISQLGSTKELAKGYLSDIISINTSFNFRKILMLISFYGLTGLSGMFIIPCGSVLSIGLIICGIISPIAGLVKAIGFLLGIEVPYVMFQLGNITLHPLIGSLVSVVMGILLFILGKIIWNLVIKYIRTIGKVKKTYIEP